MNALKIKSFENQFLISIDKSSIDEDYLLEMLERLKLEYLAKKADFNEEILDLAKEIKSDWWMKNKEKFLFPLSLTMIFGI